jgi:predicted HicB family RNase H-like nuclease
MTTLPPYKGFQASVEYDDGVLLITVLHINDSVSATCNNASEVIPTFRDLIDDYVETCAELEEEPNRPFKGSFNVRIGSALHQNAAMAAASLQLTLNSWVADAIREKIERASAERGYLLRDLDAHATLKADSEDVQEWVADVSSTPQEADVVQMDRYRTLAEQKKRVGQ